MEVLYWNPCTFSKTSTGFYDISWYFKAEISALSEMSQIPLLWALLTGQTRLSSSTVMGNEHGPVAIKLFAKDRPSPQYALQGSICWLCLLQTYAVLWEKSAFVTVEIFVLLCDVPCRKTALVGPGTQFSAGQEGCFCWKWFGNLSKEAVSWPDGLVHGKVHRAWLCSSGRQLFLCLMSYLSVLSG